MLIGVRRISTPEIKETSYLCGACGNERFVPIDREDHKEKVKNSANGLAVYTDIHRCFDGTLSINNLHIDKNFDVRSFSLLELPNKRKKTMPDIPGMPAPKRSLNTYIIDRMLPEKGFRLVLTDKHLHVQLNIGDVAIDREERLARIESENGQVILDYYPSEIPFRWKTKKWFEELVNSIENLPPTQLGLFIATLRHVHKNRDHPPSAFEIQQLKTILSSHKITCEISKNKISPHILFDIKSKYGETIYNHTDKIIPYLKEHNHASLKTLVDDLDMELIDLTYAVIILEMEGVLLITSEDDLLVVD